VGSGNNTFQALRFESNLQNSTKLAVARHLAASREWRYAGLRGEPAPLLVGNPSRRAGRCGRAGDEAKPRKWRRNSRMTGQAVEYLLERSIVGRACRCSLRCTLSGAIPPRPVTKKGIHNGRSGWDHGSQDRVVRVAPPSRVSRKCLRNVSSSIAI